jgi:hypothetical protein
LVDAGEVFLENFSGVFLYYLTIIFVDVFVVKINETFKKNIKKSELLVLFFSVKVFLFEIFFYFY